MMVLPGEYLVCAAFRIFRIYSIVYWAYEFKIEKAVCEFIKKLTFDIKYSVKNKNLRIDNNTNYIYIYV